MNKKRLLSGVLGFPLVVLILVFANVYIIDIAFAIIAIMALREYFNALKEKANPVKEIGYFSVILILIMHLVPEDSRFTIITLSIPILLLLLFLRVITSKKTITTLDIATTLFGIVYIVIFLLFLPMIYGTEHGRILIWFVFWASWGTDTFAYFIGRKLGKHKFTRN